MKQIIFITIIQVFSAGYLLAQQPETKNLEDSILSKKTVTVNDSHLSTIHKAYVATKDLTSTDSLILKKVLDSIEAANRIFPLTKSLDQFDSNLSNKWKKFAFKPLPKQKYYFAIHDYSYGWNMSSVSRYDNAYMDHPKNFNYLWSGHMKPYMEIGFSKDYFDSDQRSSTLIYLIRDKKRITGFGINKIRPEFQR